MNNDEEKLNCFQVYTAVMDWVKHDLSDREYLLPGLLSLVRLVFIPTRHLINEMKVEPLIYSNPECKLKII